MDMSERIKQLRVENNMTQEELGKVIGVQRSAIRKYEAGAVQNIKRSSIQKMADHFGVDPSYLLGLKDDKTARVTDKDKKRAELYAEAKRSNDPVVKALVDAIDKLLGIE